MYLFKKPMKAIDILKNKIKNGAITHFPKWHLLTAGALGSLLVLFLGFTPSEDASATRSSQEITLNINNSNQAIRSPAKATAVTTPAPENKLSASTESIADLTPKPANTQPESISQPPRESQWREETVKSGDSLSLIFQRVGLSDTSLYEFMSSSASTKQLTRLYPGQTFAFNIEDGKLLGLRYQKNRLHQVEFHREEKGFVESEVIAKPDVRRAYRSATITNSLFLAGTGAGMEESLIMELANIFGWDIDFALDIRRNDNFKLLYEERFLDGEKLGNGPILAAEFTNQNKTYRAVRYTDSKGNSQYYTPEGKSMRKAFLRTPVDFARISSHFNLRRKHPVLNKIRAHKGTDYAAPTGTPIKAAGDGKVIVAGTKGGYGRTVIIQHGQTYKTVYAHMRRYGKGIRSGTRVKQGQTIGYVGSSGLATGPHLHYEFHVNGAVKNPLTVKLPKARSVPKAEAARFKAQIKPLVATLDKHQHNTQLASAKTDSTPTTN